VLEKVAVPAFQSQFMIMNDRAAHFGALPQLCPVSSK
jgi:hypothetical protein